MEMSDQWEYDGEWHRVLHGEGALVKSETLSITFGARGVPPRYYAWQKMEIMIKIFKRPYNIFLTGLVCADPNVVLLEAELRGGQIEGRARWSGLGGHVPHYSCFSHV